MSEAIGVRKPESNRRQPAQGKERRLTAAAAFSKRRFP
jgi:hypothetical protein